MCKKFLSGLMGGGQEDTQTTAAATTASVQRESAPVVKLANTETNAPVIRKTTDDEKRKTGLPGLGL